MTLGVMESSSLAKVKDFKEHDYFLFRSLIINSYILLANSVPKMEKKVMFRPTASCGVL